MSTRYYPGNSDVHAPRFELREIDAWAVPDGGWTWNDSFVLRTFKSDADDLKGLLLRVLRDVRGKPLPRGVFRVDDSDWDVLEVQRRSDGCPIWAMMRRSHER